MFVYCLNCDYETRDSDSADELKDIVKKDGGEFTFDKGTKCPKCGKNELRID